MLGLVGELVASSLDELSSAVGSPLVGGDVPSPFESSLLPETSSVAPVFVGDAFEAVVSAELVLAADESSFFVSSLEQASAIATTPSIAVPDSPKKELRQFFIATTIPDGAQAVGGDP